MAEAPSTSVAETPSATEQALEKLSDQLTCAICLEDYKEPKLLQCFHVYCKECLERLVQREQQALSCPTCRRPTPLPEDSISGLQPAFHIHHLFEIRVALEKVEKVKGSQKPQCDKCKKRDAANFCRNCQFICARCTETHRDWPELSDHEVISLSQLKGDVTQLVPPTKRPAHCSKHPSKESDLLCETCEELICRDCIVRDHRDHQYDLISAAFPKHKEVLTDCLQPVKRQLEAVDEAIESLDARLRAISEQRMAIEADIHTTFQQLQEALEERKTELIGRLDQLAQQKQKSLTAQKGEFERIQTQLSSCYRFVSESLRTGSEAEILGMKKPVVQQITEMSAEFKPDVLALVEQADLKLATTTELLPACKQFGKVYTHPVCPEKCRATGKGLEMATVGEQATATLHAVDTEDKDYIEPVIDVTCELTSCMDGTVEKGIVKKGEGNCCYISYKPAKIGRHQLHIKVEGMHIRGSPFDIISHTQFGTPIKTIGNLKGPRGVAISDRGQIVVAEKSTNSISVIESGTKIKRITGDFSIASGWIFPCGIAMDDSGNILLTDTQHNCIQKFANSTAPTVVVVGKEGKGNLQFNRPAGIGINPANNRIYVCDSYNHRVQILNSDLTHYRNFGSGGGLVNKTKDDGKFNRPSGVAFDSSGNVYIADACNHRVQIFTEDGRFQDKFGTKGTGDRELSTPVSIAVDSSDIVYVAEYDNHRVSVFTCQGQFLRSFGSHATQPGQFKEPRAIAVDGVGHLYVCDYYNNCIEIF